MAEEASVVAWTNIYRGDGSSWSITFRSFDPVSPETYADLLAKLEEFENTAREFGYTFFSSDRYSANGVVTASAMNAGNAPARSNGTQQPANPQQQNAPQRKSHVQGNSEPVARITVGRASDGRTRVVEFWAPEWRKLEYPVVRPTAQIVVNLLKRRYGISDDHPLVAKLNDLNTDMEVKNWEIGWQPSEKLNSKGNPYKDICDIYVPELEGDGGEDTEEEGAAEADAPFDDDGDEDDLVAYAQSLGAVVAEEGASPVKPRAVDESPAVPRRDAKQQNGAAQTADAGGYTPQQLSAMRAKATFMMFGIKNEREAEIAKSVGIANASVTPGLAWDAVGGGKFKVSGHLRKWYGVDVAMGTDPQEALATLPADKLAKFLDELRSRLIIKSSFLNMFGNEQEAVAALGQRIGKSYRKGKTLLDAVNEIEPDTAIEMAKALVTRKAIAASAEAER